MDVHDVINGAIQSTLKQYLRLPEDKYETRLRVLKIANEYLPEQYRLDQDDLQKWPAAPEKPRPLEAVYVDSKGNVVPDKLRDAWHKYDKERSRKLVDTYTKIRKAHADWLNSLL